MTALAQMTAEDDLRKQLDEAPEHPDYPKVVRLLHQRGFKLVDDVWFGEKMRLSDEAVRSLLSLWGIEPVLVELGFDSAVDQLGDIARETEV
ncbi:MAG TPA: hypothetical protein VFH61_15710 [Thermoleophilia bacterium]|nr:hypothetical protein [Thermoleophilia bacterium]